MIGDARHEEPRLIKPRELESGRGTATWDVLTAALTGDVAALRAALQRDPALANAEYWYMPPLHFAVREGHLDAVRLLVAAGADLTHRNALYGNDTLLQMAEDRGHDRVADYLRRELSSRLASAGSRHPIHDALAAGDAAAVERLLDEDRQLANRGDHLGRRPLHYAVEAARRDLVDLLLDAGADIDSSGFGGDDRIGGSGFRPVVLALWHNPYWGQRNDYAMARHLLDRGAEYSITVAAALGDETRVKDLLGGGREAATQSEACGKRPLSAAAERGHGHIVRRLLETGADPNLPEGTNCPRGFALWSAARHNQREIAELLLAAGADPNAAVESSGTPTSAADDADLRALLYRYGGRLGTGGALPPGRHRHHCGTAGRAAGDVRRRRGGTGLHPLRGLGARRDCCACCWRAACGCRRWLPTARPTCGAPCRWRGCCWSTAWIPTCPTGSRFARCTTKAGRGDDRRSAVVPGVRRRPRRGGRGVPLHAAGVGGALRAAGVRPVPAGPPRARRTDIGPGLGSGAGLGAAPRSP